MLNPQREAVKVLAMAVGVREAARRMGLDEHRVLKWSQRDPAGPWTLQPAAKQLSTPSVTGNTLREACPQNVLTPSAAFAEVMADDSKATRLAGSRYARRTLEHAAKIAEDTPVLALAEAQNVKAVAATAALVHSWEAKQQQPQIMVNLALLGVAPEAVPYVDVQASTVREGE